MARALKADSVCGILYGPLTGGGLIEGSVVLVDWGNLVPLPETAGKVVRVGVSEQCVNILKYVRDGEGRSPVTTQEFTVDSPIAVDIRVVDLGGELDLGAAQGVVLGEVDVQGEDSILEGAVRGPHDGRLPVKGVLADGPHAVAEVWGVLCQHLQLSLESRLSSFHVKSVRRTAREEGRCV